VILKTWQFSPKKKFSKNYSILIYTRKKIAQKKKKKKIPPKIFPNLYLLIKRQNLLQKKITCSIPNQNMLLVLVP
jgi:hypothetical protein